MRSPAFLPRSMRPSRDTAWAVGSTWRSLVDHRIASPHAVFGHRGAALGLITGWGGTQRLPRLVGKGRALEMFVAAEKIIGCQRRCGSDSWMRLPTIPWPRR